MQQISNLNRETDENEHFLKMGDQTLPLCDMVYETSQNSKNKLFFIVRMAGKHKRSDIHVKCVVKQKQKGVGSAVFQQV